MVNPVVPHLGRGKETWACRAVPWGRCSNVWWILKRKWQEFCGGY